VEDLLEWWVLDVMQLGAVFIRHGTSRA
jgi:hypothetical protein